MPNKTYVNVRNLTFLRGDRPIFDNISLKIPRGKITAIMGPSGTGKTTLLRLIGGEIQPDKGQITVDGKEVTRLSHKELFKLRRKMGMLFQSGALFTDLNVYDNVAFPLREHTKLKETLIRQIVLMKLQTVGLRGADQLMASELSGGMRRRVALARAIALDPQMIMYDEPFAGQDPIAMGMLLKLIASLNEVLGLTSIIVTHDIAETLQIADYVYIISHGQIIGEGTAEKIRHSKSEEVKQFIEGLPDGPVPFHYPAADYRQQLIG